MEDDKNLYEDSNPKELGNFCCDTIKNTSRPNVET